MRASEIHTQLNYNIGRFDFDLCELYSNFIRNKRKLFANMKPSSLLRLRNVWIATCWLRNEAVAAAAMVIRHRDCDETDDRVGCDQKPEAEVGQVGVDGRGKLRIVRIMDDYIVPAECGF